MSKTKNDFAYPIIWTENNLSFIDENLKYLKNDLLPLINYVIYINYLILKKQYFLASNEIYTFEKNNPKSIYIPLLKSIYYNSIRNYTSALNQLNKIFNLKINSFSFYIYTIKLCINAKEFSNAKRLYEQIKFYNWTIEENITLLNYISIVYHLDFDFEKSIEIKKNELMQLLPLLKKQKNSISEIKKTFNTNDVFNTMINFIKYLESNGLKPFPIAGTLLGWYRNDEILPHDKDLDIGVLSIEELELVKILIEKNSRYKIDNTLLNFSSYISVIDLKTNYCIDILAFWKKGKYFENGWVLPSKYKKYSRILKFTPFKLEKKLWKNNELYCIEDTKLYLTELYGEWEKEDKYYYSPLSAKNLLKNTPMITSVAYHHMVSNLNMKNFKKAKSIALSLKKYDMSNQLLDEVSNLD